MSLGRTLAVALHGLAGTMVDVEAHVGSGLPYLGLSGLPDTACSQATDRIRSAAANCGLPLPSHRIVVNLSPASIPKRGTGFDLAIAMAVLSAAGTVGNPRVRQVVHVGELGLDGCVRGLRGVLPMVVAAANAGVRSIVVPADNVAEAQLVDGITVHAARNLGELVAWYATDAVDGLGLPLPGSSAAAPVEEARSSTKDLAEVVGQPEARIALELAAIGGHHVLLRGVPGVGKTMLAERLVTILPKLTRAEALETQAIRSLAGVCASPGALDHTPPFEAPHHSATVAAITGGGSSSVVPGAISRAHGGVLFLDEAPEFSVGVLQTLRQPLESGTVTISRAKETTTYPARFLLVLAANPCPCGLSWGRGLGCSCPAQAKLRYSSRLSGPLLDRIDIRASVPPVPRGAFAEQCGESSAQVRARVERARAVQRERWAQLNLELNGRVPGAILRRPPFRLSGHATAALDRSIDLGLISLRGYDRVLRLAWSAADSGGKTSPGPEEVGFALALRSGDEVAA